MKSRIAIFEGYGRPPSRRRPSRRYGAALFENPRLQRYGAPLFENPRLQRYGAPLFENPRPQRYGFEPRTMPQGMGGYGRRGYYVPPLYGPSPWGPETESGRKSRSLKRKAYRVKKGKNSPAQVRFKKAAKKCARKARGRGARKGAYQSCMRQTLKGKRSKR
jgi:hypothetical protein